MESPPVSTSFDLAQDAKNTSRCSFILQQEAMIYDRFGI
jgi:hypothetical protein